MNGDVYPSLTICMAHRDEFEPDLFTMIYESRYVPFRRRIWAGRRHALPPPTPTSGPANTQHTPMPSPLLVFLLLGVVVVVVGAAVDLKEVRYIRTVDQFRFRCRLLVHKQSLPPTRPSSTVWLYYQITFHFRFIGYETVRFETIG